MKVRKTTVVISGVLLVIGFLVMFPLWEVASAQQPFRIFLPIFQRPGVVTPEPTLTPSSTPTLPPPTLTPSPTPDLRRADFGDEWGECNLLGCTAVLFEEINTRDCIGPFTVSESESKVEMNGTTYTWAGYEAAYGHTVMDRERGTSIDSIRLVVYLTAIHSEYVRPFSPARMYYVVGQCSATSATSFE